MNESENFKAGEEKGLISGRLASLQNSVEDIKIALNNLTTGLGSRVKENEDAIGFHRTSIGIMQEQITTLKILLWGFVGLIVTGVVGALLRLVLKG